MSITFSLTHSLIALWVKIPVCTAFITYGYMHTENHFSVFRCVSCKDPVLIEVSSVAWGVI